MREVSAGGATPLTPAPTLFTCTGPLAARRPHPKPPRSYGDRSSRSTFTGDFEGWALIAPVVTFLLRPLAQEAQDSPPSCAVPSSGSDQRIYRLGHLGSDGRREGPFPGQMAFWPLPEPRLLFGSSRGDADVQPVPGHHGRGAAAEHSPWPIKCVDPSGQGIS